MKTIIIRCQHGVPRRYCLTCAGYGFDQVVPRAHKELEDLKRENRRWEYNELNQKPLDKLIVK